MVIQHCRGICKQLEGYEYGHYHFQVEGKNYCSECYYKIKRPDLVRCPCCHGKYRVKRQKVYQHQKEEIEKTIVRY